MNDITELINKEREHIRERLYAIANIGVPVGLCFNTIALTLEDALWQGFMHGMAICTLLITTLVMYLSRWRKLKADKTP